MLGHARQIGVIDRPVTFRSPAARFGALPGRVPPDFVARADPSSILSGAEGSGGGVRGVAVGEGCIANIVTGSSLLFFSSIL